MEAWSLLVNLRKGMQSSSEQPLVGEEHCVTTLITAAKETKLVPTWRKILAHSWHSFVLATGMNGMWTNGGAKALVLSSSSVTWVMFFTWILANVVFRRTCHGQRLLVQAIKLSFHLKSVFFMALYPRQNSRFAFDVQVYHLTMRHLSFIIQHCCLRCDIGVSQWHIGVLTFKFQHSTLKFIIQHSSFKLNFTDEWLTFWSESAKTVGRKESRKHKIHRSLYCSTCRMDSNAC